MKITTYDYTKERRENCGNGNVVKNPHKHEETKRILKIHFNGANMNCILAN